MAFEYADAPVPIRSDLAEAHRRFWQRLAEPGTWWSGPERVAIAAETRAARDCALCAERKAALSPFSVDGEHDKASGSLLPDAAVDAVHRLTTDASRLSKSGYEKQLAAGLSPEQYVEAIGVAVQVISVDRFHHALGLPPEPLPQPQPGAPTRRRPSAVVQDEAWVPWLDVANANAEERALFPAPRVPNVLRALSLVPAEVTSWRDIAAAQYIADEEMISMDSKNSLSREQIELVAGRTSALNECFY